MVKHIQPRALLTAALACAAPSAFAQTTLYTLTGTQAGDEFGALARGVGDVDADGAQDLVVSSALGAAGAGYVRVFSGSRGVALFEIVGAAAGDEFGAAAEAAGDVDHDGRDDLLVGAPGAGGSGRAYLVSGADGSILRTFLGSGAGDRFGAALAALGDVDGDLVGDFAVGAPFDDDAGSNSGSVRVISGASGAMLRQHDGLFGGHQCGTSLAALADLDGDGVAELAVGEPYDTVVSSNQPGRVRVFSGATGATLLTRSGQSARDRFGVSVADAGDVDGDGLHDLLVGAPQPKPNAAGYARILSGASGVTLRQFNGDASGDQFGSAVACAGDVDGDGVPEALCGAPFADSAWLDSGRVKLLSCASGATLATFDGDAPASHLGAALSGACDVNSDGVPDALLACPNAAPPGPASGTVLVVSTRTLSLAPATHLLSLATLAPLALSFDGGAARAGSRYVALGSIDGTLPGTSIGGLRLPLNSGRYLDYSLRFVPGGVLAHQRGLLDASGHAAPLFDPWRSPSVAELVGLTFHHVVVLIDATGAPSFVSNAAPVTLTP